MAIGYPLPAPLPAPPPSQGMGRGTRVLLWSLGGCSVVAILLIVGAMVAGGLALTRAFNLQMGHISAPGDFPVYPGAKTSTGIKMGAKDGLAGHSVSLVQWQAPDGGDKVSAWYEKHLNQGDWEVIDHAGSRFHFRRRSTGATALVQVQGELTNSIIQLEMTGDQPLAPGATPVSTDSPNP